MCWDCKTEIPQGMFRCQDCIDSWKPQEGPSVGAWTRRTNFEREKYADDIAQPYTKRGGVNEKFVKKYGANSEAYHEDVKAHYKKKGL